MKIDPNAPAFPVPSQSTLGLTKREYFAAMAMQGMLSVKPIVGRFTDAEYVRLISEYGVKHADALIDALNNEGGAA